MFALDHATQLVSLAASFATVFALVGVWSQIRSARRLQERAAANNLYSSFLQTAAANPAPLNVDPGKSVIPGSDRDWMIYFWLTALESGWSAFGRDATWSRRIDSCARQNYGFFQSSYWCGVHEYANKGVSLDFDKRFVTLIAIAVSKETQSPKAG